MKLIMPFKKLSTLVLFLVLSGGFCFAKTNSLFNHDENKNFNKTLSEHHALGCEQGTDFKFEVWENIFKGIATSNADTKAQYKWDFGDGSIDIGQLVKHEFKSPGEYKICVTSIVSDITNTNVICEETVCKIVKIGKSSDPCNLNPDFKFEIKNNILVLYGGSTAGSNASYRWSISDGTIYSGQVVKHELKKKGEYEVCLTVISGDLTNSNLSCTATICKKVSLSNTNVLDCQLKADFSFELNGNTLKASGFSEAGSNAIYRWRISDGSEYSGQDIKHEFKEKGDYEVCLIITPTPTVSTSLSKSCTTTICKKISLLKSTDEDCNLKGDFKYIRANKSIDLFADSNDPNAEYIWTIEGQNITLKGNAVSIPFLTANTARIRTICLTIVSKLYDCKIQICKNIANTEKPNSLIISPNPATDFVHVQTDQIITSYWVYDSMNAVLQSESLHSESATIDVSTLKSGVYVIVVQYDDGSSEIKRIIK